MVVAAGLVLAGCTSSPRRRHRRARREPHRHPRQRRPRQSSRVRPAAGAPRPARQQPISTGRWPSWWRCPADRPASSRSSRSVTTRTVHTAGVARPDDRCGADHRRPHADRLGGEGVQRRDCARAGRQGAARRWTTPSASGCPSCRRRGRAVTLRQLLSHTSGLPDFSQSPAFGQAVVASLRGSHRRRSSC